METWPRSHSQSLCEKNPGPSPREGHQVPFSEQPALGQAGVSDTETAALGSWFAFQVGVAGLGPPSRPGCSWYPLTGSPSPLWASSPFEPSPAMGCWGEGDDLRSHL